MRYLETILVVFFRGRLGRIPFFGKFAYNNKNYCAKAALMAFLYGEFLIELIMDLGGTIERPTEMCKVYRWGRKEVIAINKGGAGIRESS